MSVVFIKNKTKEELNEIISQSFSRLEVMRKCGVESLNNHVKKWLNNYIEINKIDISHFSQGNPAHRKYSYDDMKTWVESNICWTDLMKDMGLRFVGDNIKTAKKVVKYYNLDISHFDAKAASKKNNSKTKSLNDIFCRNSSATRVTVKSRILSLNLIPYKCSGPNCTITDTWNGQPIVLHLEHINGIGNDNRLDNLCFLCPNCHSQTSTYAGRNVQGKKRAVDGSFITLSPL